MSVANDILDTAATALKALTFAPTPAKPFSVRKRKQAAIGEDELPAVVVSLGGGEQVEELTATQVVVTYPVLVEFGVGGGSNLGDTAPVLAWREQVRKKLHARATWTGLTGWNQTLAQPLAPFDRGALDKSVSLSLQKFVVEVIESRE